MLLAHCSRYTSPALLGHVLSFSGMVVSNLLLFGQAYCDMRIIFPQQVLHGISLSEHSDAPVTH